MEKQDQCEETYIYSDTVGDVAYELAMKWQIYAEDKTAGAREWMPESPKEEVRKDMMRLYAVHVVDTKKNRVFDLFRVIAKEEVRAKMKVVKLLDIDPENDNLEFFVQLLGEWESKKPKEVKIVKE